MPQKAYRWSLFLYVLVTGPVLAQVRSIVIHPEVITTNAVTGDGGNAWGGHQCRVVRTGKGVFTAYTVGGSDYLQRTFHLVKRTEEGWKELTAEKAGREPVNLMASPDGALHIIAYPEYTGTHFYGIPEEDTIHLNSRIIPALYHGHHPYNSAGIDSHGNICALSTSGGEVNQKGAYLWAFYHADSDEWQGRRSFFDYRYCYAYVFPHPDRSVTLEATRDVVWEAMNYRQPPGKFRYMFNGIGVWKARPFDGPLVRTSLLEEFPTEQTPYVLCAGMNDAYMDTEQRLHVLSRRQSERTGGTEIRFHSIFDQEGMLLADMQMDPDYGMFCRIFQDKRQRYFLLGSTGLLSLLDAASWEARESVIIDLKDNPVLYSGFGLAVPRTGSKLSDTMDVVYPSGEYGERWMYFQLHMDELFPPE
jgi:hypothetical protein